MDCALLLTQSILHYPILIASSIFFASKTAISAASSGVFTQNSNFVADVNTISVMSLPLTSSPLISACSWKMSSNSRLTKDSVSVKTVRESTRLLEFVDDLISSLLRLRTQWEIKFFV